MFFLKSFFIAVISRHLLEVSIANKNIAKMQLFCKTREAEAKKNKQKNLAIINTSYRACQSRDLNRLSIRPAGREVVRGGR